MASSHKRGSISLRISLISVVFGLASHTNYVPWLLRGVANTRVTPVRVDYEICRGQVQSENAGPLIKQF